VVSSGTMGTVFTVSLPRHRTSESGRGWRQAYRRTRWVLLSMFFFYVRRRSCTLVARGIFAAASSRSFLCVAHGPPITRLHTWDQNTTQLARPWRNPPGVGSRPPRGVTVFAERGDQPGASNPQKQRRHFPPSHRLWVRSSRPHVSTTHAPSRRLQRVSVSCARVSLGQAPRRRPPVAVASRYNQTKVAVLGT
jgi:hypothetical protein